MKRVYNRNREKMKCRTLGGTAEFDGGMKCVDFPFNMFCRKTDNLYRKNWSDKKKNYLDHGAFWNLLKEKLFFLFHICLSR